ncbi:hypothetical protein [Erwinia aphidicola]|uniref:Uncharacterized protein n=1 Tax=Erwinia aphidicola TaxID=68334 RepID=A0ABU8DM98_ERWAP
MKKLPAPDNQRQPSEEELSLAAYLAAKPAPQIPRPLDEVPPFSQDVLDQFRQIHR